MIFSKIDEENSDTILGRVKQTLVNHVDIGARFSEARCSKALPLAFAAYKEGLQSHYLAEVHNAKVSFVNNLKFFEALPKGFQMSYYSSSSGVYQGPKYYDGKYI